VTRDEQQLPKAATENARGLDDGSPDARETPTAEQKPPANKRPFVKWAGLAALVVTAFSAYFFFGDQLSLDRLAAQESSLRSFQDAHPILVYGIAFSIYVAVTGLSLPGATVLTLVFGWYFGFARALVLVSFASTAGATLAFLLSRLFFRDSVQNRFGDTLEKFNESLRKEGAFYLFTLRLIPAVPFFVINAVMGLTPMSAKTFWWVSQIGMLPGTIVYVYAGSRVPSLRALADEGVNAVISPSQMTQIVAALAMLGVFPLVVRFVFTKLAIRRQASPSHKKS